MNRLAPFAALTVIAALASPAAAQTGQTGIAPMIPATGTVLDVTAEGRTTRVPDLATIRAGTVTQGATAAKAMTDNAAAMARVLAAVRKAGVASRDLATATVLSFTNIMITTLAAGPVLKERWGRPAGRGCWRGSSASA